jgi:hypothetical protein
MPKRRLGAEQIVIETRQLEILQSSAGYCQSDDAWDSIPPRLAAPSPLH